MNNQNYISNPFILLIGKSGTGKTTEAELSGLPCVQSYTTRPKRFPDETGHIFVQPDDFPLPSQQVAYTEFDGYKYCATHEQVENNAIYIIDPDGAIDFLVHTKTTRPIVVLYIHVSWWIRLFRMLKRGDGVKAFQRVWHDRTKFDSLKRIHEYKKNNTRLLTVNANHAKIGSINKLLNKIYFKEV